MGEMENKLLRYYEHKVKISKNVVKNMRSTNVKE